MRRPCLEILFSMSGMAAIGAIIVSCQPTEQLNTSRTPEAVHVVSCQTLLRDYRDLSQSQVDATWTGRKIRLSLVAEGYKVKEDRIEWYAGLPGAPPAIVFICLNAPIDNKKYIQIIGRCHGKDYDDINRGMGITWGLVVRECAVTPVE